MKKKQMLPKSVEQLMLDIANYLDKREGRALEAEHSRTTMVQKDPVAVLVSLLKEIKEELPEVSAMLSFTVDMGFFVEDPEEADEEVKQAP